MTPHEKAEELVSKFDGVGLQMRNEAIACALIAVDEILNMASKQFTVYHYSEDGSQVLGQWPERTYWFWVKQEIEKL